VHLGYSVSNVEGSRDTAGPARGISLGLGLDLADEFTGSDDSFYAATYEVTGYLPMPWPGAHTLAMRSAGGLSAGEFARRSIFAVGGYDLENVTFPDTLTTVLYNGTFVLRGYAPGAYRGTTYMLNQLEYRFPLAEVDRGISTVPIYLRRIDANAFVDWGGAFNRFDFDEVRLFHDGALVDSPNLATGIGGELWFHVTAGYAVPLQLRLGYALGLSAAAIPGGQGYFIAAAAF
jgi:outer membrane protein assembly factor BamA